MSTPTPSTTVTPSSSPTTDPTYPDHEPINSNPTQYYNYLFLLLAACILVLLVLLIYYLRRRRQNSLARRQQHGRAALIRDVARFPSTTGGHGSSNNSNSTPFFWSQRPSSLYSEEEGRTLSRTRNPRGDSVLEAGLDARGGAPPPYGAAAAAGSTRIIDGGKAGLVPGREWRGVEPRVALARQGRHRGLRGESRVSNGRVAPPDYDWRNRLPEEGPGVDVLPVRPAEVVTVVERAVDGDMDVDDRPLPRDPRRASRRGGDFR